MRKLIPVFLLILVTQTIKAQIPTWSEHVAGIIYDNCSSCHRDGGIGPFELMSYEDAFSYANSIKAQTEAKLMPPWKPDPNYVHLKDERILTESDINTIAAWVDGGMPSGDMNLAPLPPIFPVGSQMSVIDQTIQWPQWTVTTDIDQYRTFVYHSNYTEDMYLNQVEYLPGNGEIVHHMVLFYDAGTFTSLLDQLDPLEGYESYGLGPISFTAVLLGAWAPGSGVFVLPPDMGMRIPAGADIGLEIHYSPGSNGLSDASKLNFRFSTAPAIREVYTSAPLNHLENMTDGPLFVPANTVKTFHEKFKLTGGDVSLISVFPHMHRIGSSIKTFNTTTNGDTTKLISIPRWSFHWQGFYNYQKLIHIKNQSTFWAEATFDNTTSNPDNPSNPPQDVSAGEHTTDEMMIIFFAYAAYKPGDENIILDSTLLSAPQVFAGSSLPLHIFPNPVASDLHVGTKLQKGSFVTFELCDAAGSVIREWQKAVPAGVQSNSLSMEGVSAGIYFLKATSVDGNAVVKVIKH